MPLSVPAAVIIIGIIRPYTEDANSTALYPAMFACEDNTSMLCARVVRGAASSANAVSPAAFIAAMPSLLNGSSMPTTTVPRFICASSFACGERTFNTVFAPNASTAPPIDAPAAV